MASQEWAIRNHLISVAKEYNLDYNVTISFVQTELKAKKFCLTKKDTPDAFRMVRAYSKAVTEAAYGRSNKLTKTPEAWLPMILLPEYRDAETGEPTFLHYHGLIRLPRGREQELIEFTTKFWIEIGQRNFNSPIKSEVEPARTLGGSMYYGSKWFEDQFTLEKSVICGPVIKRYS